MFRLTRQVRFAINAGSAAGRYPPETNAHAGAPPLVGLGHYFILDVTITGELDPRSSYLLNIKDIDRDARAIAIPLIDKARDHPREFGARLLARLHEALRSAWAPARLEQLTLWLSPFLSMSVLAREVPMTRLSQKFEFAASHRLHNPSLSEQQNRELFGKCNNPHGHGHNYELQVTLAGEPGDASGMLMDIPQLERIVDETVIRRFDHRNLNVELPEFAQQNPTVENIARVIFELLRPRFSANVRLAGVTVWETPKTWCEYFED